MITNVKIVSAVLDTQLEQVVNREIRKSIHEHTIIEDIKYYGMKAMIIFGEKDYPHDDTGPGI